MVHLFSIIKGDFLFSFSLISFQTDFFIIVYYKVVHPSILFHLSRSGSQGLEPPQLSQGERQRTAAGQQVTDVLLTLPVFTSGA